MSKDQSYHEDAVKYNQTIAEAAEKLTSVLKHPTIVKWCAGIAKQHRFHLKRHERALEKMDLASRVEAETAEPSIAEQQAAFAAAQEKTEINA